MTQFVSFEVVDGGVKILMGFQFMIALACVPPIILAWRYVCRFWGAVQPTPRNSH